MVQLVILVRLGTQDPWEQLATLVLRVPRDPLDRRVWPVTRVLRVFREIPALRVTLVQLARRGILVPREMKDQQDRRETLVPLAQLAIQVR